MSSLEEIQLNERFAGAESDLAHVRRQLINAKDRIKVMPRSELMSEELRHQMCNAVYDKLVVLASYNYALAKRDQKALPLIEDFLNTWKHEEHLLAVMQHDNAIPAIWPLKLDGSSAKPEEPEDEEPLGLEGYQQPQKGQNGPIPQPD